MTAIQREALKEASRISQTWTEDKALASALRWKDSNSEFFRALSLFVLTAFGG